MNDTALQPPRRRCLRRLSLKLRALRILSSFNASESDLDADTRMTPQEERIPVILAHLATPRSHLSPCSCRTNEQAGWFQPDGLWGNMGNLAKRRRRHSVHHVDLVAGRYH